MNTGMTTVYVDRDGERELYVRLRGLGVAVPAYTHTKFLDNLREPICQIQEMLPRSRRWTR